MNKKISGKNWQHETFIGKDLTGEDFSGVPLEGKDFTGATLNKVNFTDAELTGAKFNSAKLQGADFTNACLERADFSGANIEGTIFANAILCHANFTKIRGTGLNPSWRVVLVIISFILCISSAFTSAIAVTFWMYFFSPQTKKSSLSILLFAWFSSVIVIVSIRTLLSNLFFLELIRVHVILGITFILIMIFCVVPAVTVDESRPNTGSLMLIAFVTLLPLGFTLFSSTFAGGEYLLVQKFPPLTQIVTGLANKTDGIWLSGIFGALIGSTFGCFCSQLAIDEDRRFNWLWKMYVGFVVIGGTNFDKADLTDAIFTDAYLKGANFKNSIILRTRWHNAKYLQHASVGNSYLKHPKVRQLVVRQKLENQNFNSLNREAINFDDLNLEGINLEGAILSFASFKRTNLNNANLQRADLKDTNLKQAELDGANLTETELTRACVENWIIGDKTILENVICDFVYLKEFSSDDGYRKRLPQSPKKFKPGDLKRYFQGESNTAQILIRNDDNRQALTTAFQELISKNRDIKLDNFREFKMIGDDLLVTIKLPEDSYEGVLEKDWEQRIQHATQKRTSNSRLGEDSDIPLLKFVFSGLLELLGGKMSGERHIHVEKGNYIEKNDGTYVQGNYINMSQTLNQAAPHIEELVNELQNKGFATDVAQQKAAKEIVVQVQQNPTMKDNLKNWALSLADATISDVVKGTVKIALQSAGIPLP